MFTDIKDSTAYYSSLGDLAGRRQAQLHDDQGGQHGRDPSPGPDPRGVFPEGDTPVTVSRVGRGGAWYQGEVHARASYRGRDRYDLRPDDG